MGFLEWLFGKKTVTGNDLKIDFAFHRPGPESSGEYTAIGNANPICPYCGHKFERMPARKKECPDCKKTFFVRTRPLDNKKVLLTGDQTIEAERQVKIRHGQFDKRQQKAYNNIRQEVKTRLGRDPTNYEIMTAFLTEECGYFASRNDWGFYTNVLSEQAKLSENVGDLKGALVFYLSICYLDLNGQNNLGGLGGRPSPGIKRFDPNSGFLAPGNIQMALEISEKLGMSRDDTKKLFFEFNSKIHKVIHTPLSVNKAWEIIEEQIGEPEIDENDGDDEVGKE